MNPSTRVRTTAYVVVAAYSLVFLVYGISLPHAAGKASGFLPTILVLLFATYDNYLWHHGPLLRAARQPYISGTWHGQLSSYRRDSQDTPIESTHEVFLVIRQTLTSISITLISAESKSRSAAAQVIRLQSLDFVVQYQYQNEPKLEFRQKGSTTHTGGASIEVGGLRPVTLDGEYWTARETRGTYSASRVGKQHINTFDEGQQLLQAQGGH